MSDVIIDRVGFVSVASSTADAPPLLPDFIETVCSAQIGIHRRDVSGDILFPDIDTKRIQILRSPAPVPYQQGLMVMEDLRNLLLKQRSSGAASGDNQSDSSVISRDAARSSGVFLSQNCPDSAAEKKQIPQNLMPDPSCIGFIWLLEHEPVYTIGRSTPSQHLASLQEKVPGSRIWLADRGGMITYHGPGQLVVYFVCDLLKFFAPKLPDIRVFIEIIYKVIINMLTKFGIISTTNFSHPGIWVSSSVSPLLHQRKIAFLGLKASKWLTYHGFSLNIQPQQENFSLIDQPCGIYNCPITSIAEELKKPAINDDFMGAAEGAATCLRSQSEAGFAAALQDIFYHI